jgi:hypothetical protein
MISIIKGLLGVGLLALPSAFNQAGLYVGGPNDTASPPACRWDCSR